VFRSPIKRRSDGSYRFGISPEERHLVADVVGQLRQLLLADDPSLARLFPPPYGDDAERNAGYAALAGSELIERRLASIDLVLDTLHSERLTREQLEAWMRTINDARLVLATRIGIEDEEPAELDDETSESAELNWYQHLSALLELIVRALSD